MLLSDLQCRSHNMRYNQETTYFKCQLEDMLPIIERDNTKRKVIVLKYLFCANVIHYI